MLMLIPLHRLLTRACFCFCGEKIGDKVFHDPPPTRYTTYVWLYQW